MSDDTTARLALPLLVSGQAHKEETHNEALALIDLALCCAVEASGVDVPPEMPLPGQCWIVGSAPRGAWSGQAGALAGWTGAGWQFGHHSTGHPPATALSWLYQVLAN